MSVEATILSQLLINDEYARRVLPFLRSSYFHEKAEKILFKTYVEYWQKYNTSPTKEALSLEVSNREDLTDSEYDEAIGIVEHGLIDDDPNFDWLVDTTETWCQDKAIYNAVTDAISIIDGEDETRSRHAIPDLLKEALGVTFTTNIGHDYIEDAEARFKFYGEEFARMPFDLNLFNKITNGGVPDGTLNVILAGCVHPDTLVRIRYKSKS